MNNKPRKPWLAGLLTLFTIGLGHMYAGKPRKGLILFLAQDILLVLGALLILNATSLIILILFMVCGFAYFIYCLLDAIKIAKKNNHDYQLKKYNKWYVYLAFWITAALIIQPSIELAIKKNIVHPYKIPSEGMEPSLLQGDYILVDTSAYKNNEPQRGDIIVFPYPEDTAKDYVKRLIGLEGDVIEIRNKRLYINEEFYPESYILNKDPFTVSAEIYPRDFFGPIVIPQNSLFVMGDNRDNTSDSRFWGLVDKSTVKGKIRSLYWSWDSENSKVRWRRIGKTIDQITN